MALHQPTLAQRIASHQDLLRVLLITAGVIAAMIVLTVVFGVNRIGPSFDPVIDPAHLSSLPF
jgi:hypothetical protein